MTLDWCHPGALFDVVCMAPDVASQENGVAQGLDSVVSLLRVGCCPFYNVTRGCYWRSMFFGEGIKCLNYRVILSYCLRGHLWQFCDDALNLVTISDGFAHQ